MLVTVPCVSRSSEAIIIDTQPITLNSLVLENRCRASMAGTRQSRPNPGIGVQANVRKTCSGVPYPLGNGQVEPDLTQKSSCGSQLPHTPVDLSSTITDMKNKLPDLCGN